MTDVPAAAELPPPPPARRRARWHWSLLLLLPVLGISVWALWPTRIPEPPPVPEAAGFDPEIARALENARQNVLQRPRAAHEWGSLGHLFQAHGLEDAAHQCYLQAHALDPRNPTWSYLAAVRLLIKDPARAVELLETALQGATPDSREAVTIRLRLAETLYSLHRLPEAVEVLAAITEPGEQAARLEYLRGLLAFAQDDLPAAREHFEKCANIPQTGQKAAVQLARISARLKQDEAAQKWTQRAAGLPPDQDWTDLFVDMYRSLQRGSQARIAEARKAEERGDLPGAIHLLRQQLQDQPDAPTQVNLAILLSRVGQLHEAETLLQAALQEDRDSVMGQYSLAVVQYFQAEELRKRKAEESEVRQHYEQALQHARHVLQIKPDHALALQYAGLISRRLGDSASERRYLAEACRLRPELPQLQRELAATLREAGEAASAEQHLLRAEQLEAAARSLRKR